jgi:CubicO group peptidase (beta-lactamase class C family)
VTGFRTSKAQALLYYLAVTGRPYTRPTLAGLFWGDQPEAVAHTSLSKYLLSGVGAITGGKMQLDISVLQELIQQQMTAAQTPGLALAILQDDRVIYARGFGVTSVEDGALAVTPQTLFRVGMLGMPLTSAVILRLVEAGQLSLDTPVKSYLPDFAFSAPGAADQITLRQLLSASAGLPSDYQPYGWRDPAGLQRYVYEQIAQFPLLTPPGKLFRYSTPGFDLAAYIAEHVTGRPFAQLAQELLFAPLQMTRTTFDPLVAMTYPLALAHTLDADGGLLVEHRFAENTGCYPSSFAISTALDLANFALMLLQQGRFADAQILTPVSAVTLQSRQIDLYNVDDGGWGFGFFHRQAKGVKFLFALGTISSYGTLLALVPEAGLAVVMLLNYAPAILPTTDLILFAIFEQLLALPQSAPQRQTVAPDRALWPQFVGTYLGHDGGGLVAIAIVDEHLTVDWNGEQATLTALGSNRYYAENATATMTHWERIWANICIGFVPETAGPTQLIVINGEWSCRRIEMQDFPQPDPTLWPKLPGVYSDDKGEMVFTVTLAGDTLLIHLNFFDIAFPCIPVGDNAFASKLGVQTFADERNGQMQVIKGVNAIYRRRS